MPATRKQKRKTGRVMREYKRGKLHSGSKKGPRVKSRRQAIAIAMSESGQSRKRKGGKRKASSTRKRGRRKSR